MLSEVTSETKRSGAAAPDTSARSAFYERDTLHGETISCETRWYVPMVETKLNLSKKLSPGGWSFEELVKS